MGIPFSALSDLKYIIEVLSSDFMEWAGYLYRIWSRLQSLYLSGKISGSKDECELLEKIRLTRIRRSDILKAMEESI